MPHNFNHERSGLSDVRTAGWALFLPFEFSVKGNLQAHYQSLLFIVHLAMPSSATESFRTESVGTLSVPNALSINPERVTQPVLNLSAVQLQEVTAIQNVREAETLWRFRGVGNGTSVIFNPPTQPFTDWGKKDQENLYGWKGSLVDSRGNSIARLSRAELQWNMGGYFSSAQFAGPSGVRDVGSLFNTLYASFVPTMQVKGVQTPQPGNVGEQLKFVDGRRKDRDAVFFGADQAGIGQVVGAPPAQGVIWIAHGSFLNCSANKWNRLVTQLQKGVDISSLIGEQALAHTMELANIGSATEASSPTDLVFEGLTLQGLKARGVASEPALL
jgi:hypothetical protein